MHTATHFFSTAMHTFMQRMFKQPWQYLALMLLGMPLAWAAGVSISNVKITTVKQISFADAQVTVNAGSKITRTAVTQLSTGRVTYDSDKPSIASVDPDTGEVTGNLAGEATITATQAAMAPYQKASASYAVKVIGNAVTFDQWTLDPVPFGSQAFQIKAPTSNVTQAGGTPTIRYSTLNGDTSVVGITETGTVTVKAKGTATIVAEQAPFGTFAGGKTQATLEVTAIKSTFTWTPPTITLHQTLTLTDPTDSTNTVGAFSYAFTPDQTGKTIATVDGKQLTATAAGTGVITVTQAAAGNYDTTSIVVPFSVGLPTFTITGLTFDERTFDAVNRSNNTFALPSLAKPAGSSQNYLFEVVAADAAKATISNGFVTVLKPGDIRIRATLPEDPALHQKATAEAVLKVLQATPEITLSAVNRYTSDASPFNIPVASTNKDATTPVVLELVNVQPAGFATLSQDAATQQWSASFTGAGTATLVSTQAANEEFVAGRKEVTFAVTSVASLKPNTLALVAFEKFNNEGPFIPPWTAAVGDASTIEVTVVNGATNVAKVEADKQTITLTGLVGDAQVTLKQPAQGGFQPADVTATLKVLPAAFTITGLSNITRDYDPFNAANNTFELPDLPKPAGSTSEYEFESSDTNVATIVGRTVTVNKPTTGMNPTYIGITARLPADPLRHQAAIATVQLTVNKAKPSITVSDASAQVPPPGSNPPYTNAPFTVVSNSDGQAIVELTDKSASITACYTYIDAPTRQRYVRCGAEGTARITVTTLETALFQEGHAYANYVSSSTALLPNPLKLSAFAKTTTDGPFTPPWENANAPTNTIEVISSHPGVATVTPGTQTIVLTGLAGDSDITLKQPAQNGYGIANVTARLTVTAGAFQIQGLSDIKRDYDPVNSNNNTFDLPELAKPAGSTADYTFTSSDTNVATIQGRTVTVHKPTPTNASINITANLPAVAGRHQAASATVKLTVNKAVPTIDLDNVDQTIGGSAFFIPVSSSNKATPIELSLTNATPPGFATLTRLPAPDGRWTASATAAGTATLVATQAESDYYTSATAAKAFNVRTQILLPNTLALAEVKKFINDIPFKPAWTGAVGDPGTIVVTVINPDTVDVAKVGADKQTITLTGRAGNAEIKLEQLAQGGYASKTVRTPLSVDLPSFTITGLQDIERTYNAVDTAANYVDLPLLAKPQGSTSEYVFSSSDTRLATIEGRRVRFDKPITPPITITATLPEDPARHAAATATAKLTVNQATPAMALARVDTHTGVSEVDISVASNSDAPITLTLTDASTQGFVTLTQKAAMLWTAAIKGEGTGTLTASQPASASGVFTAGSVTAPISVTATALLPNPLALNGFDKLTTDAPFLPPWTGVDGRPTNNIVVDSSDRSVATVGADNQTITLTGKADKTTITLTQPATATHASATVTATLWVRAQAAQPVTLRFTPDDIPKTYGDGRFTPDVFTGTSDVLPRFSISGDGASRVAQVDSTGRVITIIGAGKATITATVSADNVATTTATATLDVSKRDPGLNVGGSQQWQVGGGAFELPLSTLSSGNLSVTSSDNDTAEATLVGSPPGSPLLVRVTPKKQGNVTVSIHQDEDGNHKAADFGRPLSLISQEASITWALPGEFVFTGAPTTVTLPAATSSNQGTPIAYFVRTTTHEATPLATLAGDQLTLKGTGTIRLIATQVAANGYAATEYYVDIPVVSTPSGALATTRLDAPDTYTANLGTFKIPFSTNSDPATAPVVFKVVFGEVFVEQDSSDPTGHTLIGKAAGDATVMLSQAATQTNSAAFKMVKVTVQASKSIIGWQNPIEVTYNYNQSVIDILPEPQSKSGARFTYSVDSSGGPTIAKMVEVNGSRLQLLGAGETTLIATQAQDGAYPGDRITTRLNVRAQANSLVFATQDLTVDTQGRVIRYPSQSPTFRVKATPTTPSEGQIGYASSRNDVATVDADGRVTIQPNAAGKEAVITATQAAWLGIAGAQAQLVIKIEQAAPQLSLAPFELPLGTSGIPPYVTDALDRAVEVTVNDGNFASVGADKRTLTALREGIVDVTVTLLATATQPSMSVSAPLNITAKVPRLSVQPAEIKHVWRGSEQKVTLVPTSDNNTGSAYSLISSDSSVASVNGLEVTLKLPANGQSGSAVLWLSQAAGNGWGPSQVQIPVQVTVQPDLTDLTDMTRKYDVPNFDLPGTVNGETVTYTSSTPAVATIIGSRTVQLNGVNTTRLEARNAANVLVKAVTLTVEPGDPLLALQSEDLASTTIERMMTASRKGDGPITYAIVNGDAAEILPNGLLLVKAPGTVTVQASLEPAGNYAGATTTAQVRIADGLPGLRITSSPTSPIDLNETFEIRFRTNFIGGEIGTALFAIGLEPVAGQLVAQTLPSKVGEEGVFRFKLPANLPFSSIRFTIASILANDFSDVYTNVVDDPRWTRTIPVNAASQTQTGTNLGPEIVLTYNPDHPITLPNTYDAAGNVVTDNRSCGSDFRLFGSSNGNVLAIGKHPRTHLDDGWYTVGVGQTWFSCAPTSSNVVPRPVLVTVLQASPELQGFDEVTLDTASPPYPLTPPSSLNKVTPWTYKVVNDDGTPSPIATVVDGKVVLQPQAHGTAWIVATQTTSPSDPYKTDSIRARLTVNRIVPKNFATLYATYGDSPFPVPRPDGIASGVDLTYRVNPAPDGKIVATIEDGNVKVLKAGSATIEALQDGTVVVATGLLVVDKAKTNLVFRLPLQSFWVEYCKGNWMSWPGANEPENSATVKGLLQTNNPEGALVYRGERLNLGWALTSEGGTYNFLKMRAISQTSRPFSVWVEQLESENYYGARSETATYWANTTPMNCSQ